MTAVRDSESLDDNLSSFLQAYLLSRGNMTVPGVESESLARTLDSLAADLFGDEPVVLSVLDGLLRFDFANVGFGAVLGEDPPSLAGRAFVDLVHPQDAHGFTLVAEQARTRSGFPHTASVRLHHKDRAWRRVRCELRHFQHGAHSGYLLFGYTTPEMRSRLTALRDELVRTIFEDAHFGIVVGAFDRTLVLVNPAASRMFGYPEEELVGRKFTDLTHPDDIGVNLDFFEQLRSGKRDYYQLEKRYLRRDGSTLFARLTVSMLRDEAGEPRFVVGMLEDLTGQNETLHRLRLTNNVFDATSEGILVTDADGRLLLANPAAQRIGGYEQGELDGKLPHVFSSDLHESAFYSAALEQLRQDGHWQGEAFVRRKDGETFPVWLNITAVRDDKARVINYIASFSDLTERKQNEEQILRLTHYDALTQLPNRSLFIDRLQQAIRRAAQEKQRISLIFVGLDHFKAVNESLGHAKGDVLLREVAARLQQALPELGTIARLGSDEFGVIVPVRAAAPESIAVTSSVLQKAETVFATPFLLDGIEVFASASFGVATYPNDAKTAEDLIKITDAAMYHAKREGGGTFKFFAEAMMNEAEERLRMQNFLRRAIERDELQLHYQPQLDLRTGKVVGVEALLRWMSRDLGFISPAKFIPIAEETGLIRPIGVWVMRTAMAQLRKWLDEGIAPLRMAINFSTKQFGQENILQIVDQSLFDIGLDPNLVEFEITEGAIMEDTDFSMMTLREFKQMGLEIAIDDFGTGYSSLAYLKRFPLDRLKIDRSFVSDIEIDPDDTAIVPAIISLAHNLSLKVIAEGVETEAQLEYLKAFGCDEVQGYYFAKPMPADQARDYIRAHS